MALPADMLFADPVAEGLFEHPSRFATSTISGARRASLLRRPFRTPSGSDAVDAARLVGVGVVFGAVALPSSERPA